MNFVKLLAKNAYDCLCVWQALVPCGFPPFAYIIMPTSIKKTGIGASSVKTDYPNNDEDGSSNQHNPSKPKYNQGQSQKGSQTNSEKDSSKGKYTQTGKGKQCSKKLNTLGGYTSRVMVSD